MHSTQPTNNRGAPSGPERQADRRRRQVVSQPLEHYPLLVSHSLSLPPSRWTSAGSYHDGNKQPKFVTDGLGKVRGSRWSAG